MLGTHPLEMIQLPIEELKPDPANPRRISDEELESLTRSIREFGLVEPVGGTERRPRRHRWPPALAGG